MGRPAIVLNWSGSGSYPAGAAAWSGQPLSLKPAGTWFTPNVKPAAEEHNWLFSTVQADMQSILTEYGAITAQNWRTALIPGVAQFGTSDNFQTLNYDVVNTKWYAGTWTAAGNAMQFYQSEDGEGWSALGPVINATGRLCAAVTGLTSGVYVAAVFVAATRMDLKRIDTLGANTWSTTDTGASAAAVDCELRVFNSLYVAVQAGAFIKTSPDGTTWTSQTVPAALAGITTGFSVAQSPTSIVAFARTANITSCMRSTNGTAWSAVSLGALIGATDTVYGVAYGQINAAASGYVVAVQTASGSKFLQSIDDGATWTQVSTFGSLLVTDIAVNGSLWVAVTELAATRASRTLYSVDGGVTWRRCAFGLSDNLVSGTQNYTRPRVYSSPAGFMQFNSKLLRLSFAAGQAFPTL